MLTIKSYGAIAVMLVCFCVIYPRFMHPVFWKMFGYSEPPRKSVEEEMNNQMYPPGYKGRPPAGPRGVGPDDVRKHMRHGPHPGMRAAADMQRQQAQGSGRGMMGVVLPMYAVGIVLYLGYTLMKVFNKSNSKQKNGRGNDGIYSWDKTDRYYPERDRMGVPPEYNGSNPDVQNFLYDQEHRQNLEDLLARVDDKNVSVEEMRLLQKRLEETEAQMTRILQAMRGINTNVDNLVAQEQCGDGTQNEENKAASGETETKAQSHNEKKSLEEKDSDSNNKEDEKEEDANVEDDQVVDDDQVNSDEKEAEGEVEPEVVDEIIKDKEDDDNDNDDNSTSNVRLRNVKLNEQ